MRKQLYNSGKKKKEEMKKIEDLVMAYSIIRHDVRFCLKHNKETIWQNGSMADSRCGLMNVLGTSVLNQLQPIKKHSFDPDVSLICFSSVISANIPDRSVKIIVVQLNMFHLAYSA